MAQPPSRPVLARELVRVIPFAAQKTFRNVAAGAGSTFIAAFDIGLVVSDVNQFIGAAENPVNNPSADPTQFAVGPFMDAIAFTTGAGGGTMLVEMAVDYTCSYRTFNSAAVPASTLTNIAGMRITARFIRVTFTNVTAAATVEFGVYVRSN